MEDLSASVSYAARAAIGRPAATTAPPAQSGAVRPPVTHHYAPFARRDVFIDLRTAYAHYTADERDDFILDDLLLPITDLLALFTDSLTKLVRLTVRTPEIAADVMARLQAGVKWSACGDVVVYGWHPSDAVVSVRLTDVPWDCPMELLKEHMRQFGHVLSAHRARERAGGRLCLPTGVVHFSMALNNAAPLPSYVDV